MLYEILNNLNINVVIPYEISQNLNPKFELREYQKEALKRFIYYLSTPDLKKQKLEVSNNKEANLSIFSADIQNGYVLRYKGIQ